MDHNVTQDDIDAVIRFLQTNPRLTQSTQIEAFEREWSAWLGVKHSVFVNSGSSANLLTLCALRELRGSGEVVVPTLGWASNISSAIFTGFTPVFTDIEPRNLAMKEGDLLAKLNQKTKAVLLVHPLGFCGLTPRILNELSQRKIPLIEDVCQATGATFQGKRVGSFGWASNFSFYYSHHLTTVEGGMICTDDEPTYQILRMLRSHGMLKEATSTEVSKSFQKKYPHLPPHSMTVYPGFNMKGTEIQAVIGRNQLGRLDEGNHRRSKNFELFLSHLDPSYFFTDFKIEGSANYALVLILKNKNKKMRNHLLSALKSAHIEFRFGTCGGNQLRQPYLEEYLKKENLDNFPNVEHVHSFGFYFGNYANLEKEKILKLCHLLNTTCRSTFTIRSTKDSHTEGISWGTVS